MRVQDIIQGTGAKILHGNADTQASSICSDSRKLRPGALFFALKGYGADGHDYIAAALAAGAAAVVDGDRRALALCAAAFYGHPSRHLTLVGVTGTNGKTTTASLLHELFMGLGYNCGLLSTIANYVGTRRSETANTTADPITINSLLSEMVSAGCEYCFMEVSSIGLEQDRVTGLHFRAGIFSNLTRDHLDYHKTFAEYLRCKKLFFDGLGSDSVAIINADDKNGPVMVQNTKARTVTYSCRSMADHTCRVMEESFEGMLLRIDGTEVWSRLIGRHNAYNLLAIYSTAIELGCEPGEALIGISRLSPVKGRLECIKGPRDIAVVIDYAHTPDALRNVLETLRDIAPERQLTCLFGCGGDRDKGKRPEMAHIAEAMADRIFVSSDNSRSERTEDIMADIRAGFGADGLAKSLFIGDRREAIRTAIITAAPSSTILLAGKGHETYQITGTEKRHFDERETVAETFASIGGTSPGGTPAGGAEGRPADIARHSQGTASGKRQTSKD